MLNYWIKREMAKTHTCHPSVTTTTHRTQDDRYSHRWEECRLSHQAMRTWSACCSVLTTQANKRQAHTTRIHQNSFISACPFSSRCWCEFPGLQFIEVFGERAVKAIGKQKWELSPPNNDIFRPSENALGHSHSGASGKVLIRDTGLIPGSRRSPGGGHGNALQYSSLKNPMDRGAWRATVSRISKSWTRLKQLSTHASTVSFQFQYKENPSQTAWKGYRENSSWLLWPLVTWDC